MTPPHFGVAGWKNSGKTTLVCRLIAEFTARGLKVAAVKHAHHGFDIDQQGRDSHNFRESGAREVVVVSEKRWALMTELRGEPEPGLEDILARLAGSDLVIVEGFKMGAHPKIETRRLESAQGSALAGHYPGIVAIATDYPVHDTLPHFDLGDIEGIADFIEGYIRSHPARCVG
ncbi:MAG: molybdopterin-guanine dinucleotide biosynthesis protein B [Hyphomicrobiales bacterium]|nr:molybdopterin-guanine dinucleotide biosynthesis protein B [Hyphomicrobiales bacterium]